MAEMDSVSRERLEYVGRIVDAMYEGLVKQVIADIKALPEECRQSGDNSSLQDVWEEFKYQLQEEESVYFEFYEQTIRDFCARRVADLDEQRRGLLWLWSNAYYKWTADDRPCAAIIAEGVADEIYERVCRAADEEPMAVDPEESETSEEGEGHEE
jgi:hypothetical protein